MTTPEVVKCLDGHFCCAVYGIGPYIADYPEQVWLAAVVQGWCPRYTHEFFLIPLLITNLDSDVTCIQITLMLKVLGSAHIKKQNS